MFKQSSEFRRSDKQISPTLLKSMRKSVENSLSSSVGRNPLSYCRNGLGWSVELLLLGGSKNKSLEHFVAFVRTTLLILESSLGAENEGVALGGIGFPVLLPMPLVGAV
ncbi:hypothetical protein RJT34_06847 [Clitoria ternatea]|uniref:Uncharacterized protein n=1 Tax=Clitoria ternatea TaxID=43366 RepID=A0AAN9K2Q0_CLITE